MALVKGKFKPILFGVFGALLLVFSSITIIREIPLLGYDSMLEGPSGNWTPELGVRMDGPYTLEAFYPPTGVVIDNVTIHVQIGYIVSMDFHMWQKKGFRPTNITDAKIHLSGDYGSIEYILFGPDSNKDSNLTTSILADPDGLLARGFIGEKSILLVSIKNRIGRGESYITLYYKPPSGRTETFFFVPPRYVNESLSGLDAPYHVTLDIMDGRYRYYPENGWIIENHTIIENQTMFLDRDLLIVKNGTLELRNSIILVNASVERYWLFTMDSSFKSDLQNQTITDAIRQDFLQHNMTIWSTNPIVKRLSDDVWVFDSYFIKRTETGLDVYRIPNYGYDPFHYFEARKKIYVGYEGGLLLYNSTVASTGNWTIPISTWESGYDIEIFGQSNIESSNIGATNDTSSKFNIFSDEVRILNSTIGMPVSCSYCSPIFVSNSFPYIPFDEYSIIKLFASNARIENNTFGVSMSAKPGWSLRQGDWIAVWMSNPYISGNTFFSKFIGINYQFCYDHPLINNNSFIDVETAILLLYSTANIETNSIINSSTGIDFGVASQGTVEHNVIFAKEPVRVTYRSNATIYNNSITGYEKYGIYSNESRTTISGNEYIPDANNSESSYAAYQEWEVDIKIIQEKLSHREPIKADIKLWSPYKPDDPVCTGKAKSANQLVSVVPEFFITNEGKRIDFMPYKLTIITPKMQTSLNIEINRLTRFESPEIPVVVKEKPYEFPVKVATVSMGIAFIAYALVMFIRLSRLKKQDLQERAKTIP